MTDLPELTEAERQHPEAAARMYKELCGQWEARAKHLEALLVHIGRCGEEYGSELYPVSDRRFLHFTADTFIEAVEQSLQAEREAEQAEAEGKTWDIKTKSWV
jgi:hypothetical protein